MDAESPTLRFLLALSNTRGGRALLSAVFAQLRRRYDVIITREAILNIFFNFRSIHRYFTLLAEQHIQRHWAKVVEDDRISNDDFEKWYGAQLKHIEGGSQNLSILQKLKLGLLQRLLGEPRVGTLRAVNDPRSPEGYVMQPTLPKRFVFAYKGKIFVREHCPNTPKLWTSGSDYAPTRSLLEDIDLFVRGGRSSFGGSVHIYSHGGGISWRPNQTLRAKSFNNVAMLEADREVLVEETTSWIERKSSDTKCILIYGPMGTGKSVLPLALAREFETKVYLLSLCMLRDCRSKAFDLLDACDAGSMLVVDDLAPSYFGKQTQSDSSFEALSDDQKTVQEPARNRLTLAAVLRYLDQNRPPRYCPLVVVTCGAENLQKASIDTNLFTLTLKMDLATRPISYQMFHSMYSYHFAHQDTTRATQQEIHAMAESFAKSVPEHKIMPVSLEQFIMKKYPSDPRKAAKNIGKWCRKRLEQEERDAGLRRVRSRVMI